MADVSRRELLKRALVVGSGAAVADLFLPAQFLSSASAQSDVPSAFASQNPLAQMPDRSWERIYRDQFAEDSSFVFTCAPNDTHNCLLRAHVKNGVIVRISPDVRLREGDGPLRQPGVAPLGSRASARRASSSAGASTATAGSRRR